MAGVSPDAIGPLPRTRNRSVRVKAANSANGRVLPFRRPLAGSLKTALGLWSVTVVKDQGDDRIRTFTLSLFSPDVRTDDDVTFVVRVPKSVIENERPQTWAEDLRVELASWIDTKIIEGGQIVWWPPLPD